VRQKFLLFQSKLTLFLIDWTIIVPYIYPYGEQRSKNEPSNTTFKINGHRLNLFFQDPKKSI